MSYSLYKDKQELFEAQITLSGASLNDSFCRLIVESKDWNLVFDGDIDKSGNVKIPIKKLKNILDEGATGKMKLEVIAENTFFSPWETDFVVKTSKSVKVEVKGATEESDKTVVETVKVTSQITEPVKPKPTPINKKVALKQFISQLVSEGINVNNISTRKTRINEISEELFAKHELSEDTMQWIINNTLKFLTKQTK